MILLLMVVVIFVAVIFFRGRDGRKLFAEAMALCNEGDFEFACYKYAETLREGIKKRKCIVKMRELNIKHGPFEFTNIERKNRHKFDCDGCSFAYHSEILYLIKKTLSC